MSGVRFLDHDGVAITGGLDSPWYIWYLASAAGAAFAATKRTVFVVCVANAAAYLVVLIWMGHIRFFDAPEPILAFERSLERERLLLAFNLGASTQSWKLPAGLAVETLAGHGLAGGAVIDGRQIVLPAYGGWIGRIGD